MSWIQKLYETYENCQSEIGNIENEEQIPLVPICHTTQKAHVQISINSEGEFLRASVVPKSSARTIIPCTESSGGRTSGESAHPLCDKLQYVAADYRQHGGNKDSYFNSYEKRLSEWCSPEYRHPKVEPVLRYVRKKRLISDLIAAHVLHVGDDRMLLKQWKGEAIKTPEIFSVLPGRINKKGEIENWQAEAFIRWLVEIPGDPQAALWTDRAIWQSWSNHYLSKKRKSDICYVRGKNIPVADQHPAKIRNDADKAKLISSNDNTNFTFRGRFSKAEQACNVGFEVTQEAHSALRWLINRQGTVFYVRGDNGMTRPSLAIVAWATSGARIPDPIADTLGLFDDEEARSQITSTTSTAQNLANNLSKLVAGYKAKLGPTEGIVIMGMDSATPGRMAITFYRELTGSDFLARVLNWHESCAWWQDFGKNKYTQKPLRFIGAPSPKDIALAAHGRRMDDKLRKATVERILPCIIDGSQFPLDIVQSAVSNTCNRIGSENWEWEKVLGITCSIYKHYHKERRYGMALETGRHTRDYLFGRLLAVADGLEGYALFVAKDKRETSAARLMQRFADHPCSTWRTIELSLVPYKARLGARAVKYLKVIDEVICAFNTEDFINDKPLTGEFLLGYHCQRKDLWPSGEAAEQTNEEVTSIEQSN
jgi:CRISPR-associated protein Csd1